MSFEEEYNAAREKLNQVRSKLIQTVLRTPLRDADAMRKYFDAYAGLVDQITLSPGYAEIGFEKFPYIGGSLPTRRVEVRAKYDGPERSYVDYGDPNQPSYDLPSVPVIVWEEKHPFDIMDLTCWENLKDNLLVFSDQPIDNVTPDFENASYKYYYADEVKGEVGEATYEVFFKGDDIQELGEYMFLLVPQYIKGNRIFAQWTRFEKWLYVFIMPNPLIVCKVTPNPQYYDSSWVRDERIVKVQGYLAIMVSTGGRKWNFMFYNHKFETDFVEETVDTTTYRYDPIYFFKVEAQTLHPPVFGGRWKIAVG